MQTYQRQSRRRVMLLTVFVVIVGALLGAAYTLSQESSEGDGEGTMPVTLFMSYIPSVQFAPVYVAVERGYFADEGIAITLEHSLNESDGVERIGSNNLKFGLISGEQVVLARGNRRPIVYVFEWFHRFPVGVASPVDLNITSPEDLAGRIVSIPGPWGASYVGLRALLNAGGLSEADLSELRAIWYTAVDNVCQGQVEAATIYVVNEPLEIEQQCGIEVNVLSVSDYATVVSNGLVTNEQTIRDRPELVRGMVRAMSRGIADTLADPDAAFAISVPEYVSDLSDEARQTQRQVLTNSLELWRSDDPGRTNPAAWDATQEILLQVNLLDSPLDDLAACYDMRFLPGQP